MPKLTLSFKGRVIDVFHLETDSTKIGRDPDCAIAIDSLAIAPVQATITESGDVYRLEAEDEAFPVLVNHAKTEEINLHHGDVIQIGKHTLTFAEDVMELGADLTLSPAAADEQPQAETEDESEENEEASSSVLQIVNGDNFGRIISLHRHMTRIGHTGGDCAMIARREEGYYISFLEGINPPTVNKQPLADQGQLLNDGDLIEVGGTQMQFHA
ncbi:MAG: FHA domain-containing protein [Candidatus Thiodiazotropha lotti]|nr:FHA domain-containing protein [Candidatus Thiodiazotropha lotti]